MALQATRAASRAAASRCLLLALSHDELGVIVDGLADPLQPVVAVALSSTCLGLRTPLRAALAVLKERHARAVTLCRKLGTGFQTYSCAVLRDAEELDWWERGLTTGDLATLGMLLPKWLPRLRGLRLYGNCICDAGIQALCAGMCRGAAPALNYISLTLNHFGPAGAEALAAALRTGAMPRLEKLVLGDIPIGNQGMAALAAPLRKLPALKQLYLYKCGIDDEGLASLFANLGKDDFKALSHLYLMDNTITDVGVARLAAAIDAGGLPALIWNNHVLCDNPVTEDAIKAVRDALRKRLQ